MKKIYLFLFSLFICNILAAQDQDYKIVRDISYTQSKNPYAVERCKLDLYYPENAKDFPTVVWFHGGGLSGGSKFIPEELKNCGLAVIAVRLIELAARHKIPVLGICRGIQMINVAFGGTLYQDLPSEYADTSVCHMQAVPGYVPTHTVRVEKGSFVAVATGMDTLRTNSFHHQAVKRVADGFRVAATATDGVVEAIEDPDRGFFGTQFHPEDHTVAGDTVMVKFFEFLVREAGKKAR